MTNKRKRSVEDASIVIRFQNQQGTKSPPIKIKTGSKLKSAFSNYASTNNLPNEVLTFAFDGARLLGEETPEELQLLSEDHIDVFMHQHGGGV